MGPNMSTATRRNLREPIRVSLLVLPDAGIGGITGMLDTLTCFPLLATFDTALPAAPPFAVELVAATGGSVPTASGIALPVHRSIAEADAGTTDIAIVPTPLMKDG